MKVKYKILIACTIASLILLLCFFEIQQFSKKNYEHNVESNKSNQKEILHAIIAFKSEFLAKITIDYACFDEMIDFLKTKDKNWAESNITVLSSYNLQSVWVYDLRKKLVYSKQDSTFKYKINFAESVFDTLLKNRQTGFFIITPEGLLEISASTIHPSVDITRKRTPQGFIFLGKIWNSNILKTISRFTHSEISFIKPVRLNRFSDEKVIVSYPVRGHDGKVVSTIFSAKEDSSISYINRLSMYIYLFFGISSFLILLILFISINKFVILPLNNITLTLKKENPTYIKTLAQQNNEFSAIAKLILDFFEQKKQLISLNTTKDKFFSIIAHDLRGPLMGLHGLSLLLHKNVAKYDKEKIEQISLSLFNASENVSSLMENLLQWAKSQIDNLEFSPQKIQLREVAAKSILDIESMAINKGIVLVNNINSGIEIMADENLLKFIIRNLLGNAIKFTPKEGKVFIDALAMSESIEISINDTGIGMSKKQLDRLFKIDSVISKNGTEGEKGTGLGLILCKEFVEKHGGIIYAFSDQGKGSTFSFTIPKRT